MRLLLWVLAGPAAVAVALAAVVLLLLTILQGGLAPRATVANLCIVISCGIFPAVAVFQIRSVWRREAALMAMSPARRHWVGAIHAVSASKALSQPSSTAGFSSAFSVA